MDAMKAPFLKSTGESQGTIDLPASFLGGSPSLRVLHEAVVAYQANQRSGTSATKTRGLVSGGGRKPWKQKGTGNARSGSIRSPLWRKGGIIFGPQPRSYRVEMSEDKRGIALQTALLEKAKSSLILVIDSLVFKLPKTQVASQVFEKAGLAGRSLVVVEKRDPVVERAARNVQGIRIIEASKVNALDLLQVKKVLITKAALDRISQRLSVN